jgi:hypothetical protein
MRKRKKGEKRGKKNRMGNYWLNRNFLTEKCQRDRKGKTGAPGKSNGYRQTGSTVLNKNKSKKVNEEASSLSK